MTEADTSEEGQDQFLIEIGRFTYEFSQLEFTIKHFLAGILSIPDKHFNSAMSAYDFAVSCKIAQDIFSKEMDPLQAERVILILKRCLALNDDRTKIMHGLWVIHGENRGVHHVSRQTQKPSQYFKTSSELSEKATLASQLRSELVEAILDIRAFIAEHSRT